MQDKELQISKDHLEDKREERNGEENKSCCKIDEVFGKKELKEKNKNTRK